MAKDLQLFVLSSAPSSEKHMLSAVATLEWQ